MAKFEFHTPQTAPEASRPALESAQKSLGFVPNLYGLLAENPAALEAYQTLAGIFAKAGFSPVEQQLVPLIVSVENQCGFCVGAHSALSTMAKVPPNIINAVRDSAPIDDANDTISVPQPRPKIAPAASVNTAAPGSDSAVTAT